mmetsp:Transcript_23161/g.72555  ORF Transcript_23161/g.72555 Transcript_23161/m.72555 type:complete len:303 (-) Transcript_23161:71-979(-)
MASSATAPPRAAPHTSRRRCSSTGSRRRFGTSGRFTRCAFVARALSFRPSRHLASRLAPMRRILRRRRRRRLHGLHTVRSAWAGKWRLPQRRSSTICVCLLSTTLTPGRRTPTRSLPSPSRSSCAPRGRFKTWPTSGFVESEAVPPSSSSRNSTGRANARGSRSTRGGRRSTAATPSRRPTTRARSSTSSSRSRSPKVSPRRTLSVISNLALTSTSARAKARAGLQSSRSRVLSSNRCGPSRTRRTASERWRRTRTRRTNSKGPPAQPTPAASRPRRSPLLVRASRRLPSRTHCAAHLPRWL